MRRYQWLLSAKGSALVSPDICVRRPVALTKLRVAAGSESRWRVENAFRLIARLTLIT